MTAAPSTLGKQNGHLNKEVMNMRGQSGMVIQRRMRFSITVGNTVTDSNSTSGHKEKSKYLSTLSATQTISTVSNIGYPTYGFRRFKNRLNSSLHQRTQILIFAAKFRTANILRVYIQVRIILIRNICINQN